MRQGKIVIVLLLLFSFTPSESLRADFFCLQQFEKLAETPRGLLQQAFGLAILPEGQKRETIEKLTRNEKISLAHAALRGGLGVEDFDSTSLPDSILFRIYPSTEDRPGQTKITENLKREFQKDAARSLLSAYRDKSSEYRPGLWFDLIQSAVAGASAKEKKEIAKAFLSKIKDFPLDWMPQSRFDQLIDEAFGLNARKVTDDLNQLSAKEVEDRFGEELVWTGFGNRNLLTPYFEFQNIIDKLDPKPGQLLVDLGSGLGRQGLFLGVNRPDVRFHGYEIVPERVSETQRVAKDLELSNVKFSQQDLSDPKFKPEAADFYYAFNPVSGATFLKMMNDLREQAVAHGKPFTLVLAFSKDVKRVLENNTGFVEKNPDPRFDGDDFARFFYFDPSKPWTPFDEKKIAEQKVLDRELNVATATINNHAGLIQERPRPLQFADKDQIEKALIQSGKNHSNLNFVTLWSWNPEEHYAVSRRDGAIVISGNYGEGRFLIEPIGVAPDQSARIMSEMLKTKKSRQFKYVSLESAKILEKDPELKVELDTGLLDYIYDARHLALLAQPRNPSETALISKDFRYKRNKALEYADNEPKPQFESITTPAGRKKVVEFVRKWAAINKNRIGESGLIEVGATRKMLERMEELGLECHALTQGGKVVGFSLGKQTSDGTFTVFAEKSLTQGPYAGAYPLLAGLQAKRLLEQNISRINRMDDGGEINLRKAKAALEPLEQPPVFRVSLRGK